MAIGDNRFSVMDNNFAQLLLLHGIDVPVSRTVESEITARDTFGSPENYEPHKFTAKILITSQYLDETQVLFGGKPKEVLKFIVAAGTLVENDEVTYNTHTYQVKNVGNVPIGGINKIEPCTATRQVEIG